jgi:hypothetical protein
MLTKLTRLTEAPSSRRRKSPALWDGMSTAIEFDEAETTAPCVDLETLDAGRLTRDDSGDVRLWTFDLRFAENGQGDWAGFLKAPSPKPLSSPD